VLRQIRWAAAILTAAALVGPTQADPKPKASEKTTCGDHGTNLHFEASPSDAARKALKDEKLVFVLHISGHFEDSDYT
jgi:hypothetical protein